MTWMRGAQRFLEVQRFDRLGARGRRALHSFAALDAEFVGSGGNWPVIARALWKSGVITPQAFDTACLLWAFGTLIGNTDMHSGNLSCMSEGRRPYELAPAYDMTLRAFAPTAGGGLPDRTLELTVGKQVSAAAWKGACNRLLRWRSCSFVGWRMRKGGAQGSTHASPRWCARRWWRLSVLGG